MKNIGETLKYLRLCANLSQEQLARDLNITQQNISRWESGKVEPSISFCIILADYYGISVDELIGREIKK